MRENRRDRSESAGERDDRMERIEMAVKSPRDRPGDPLFVPHVQALLEVRALEAAESATADGDDYGFLLESICGVRDDSQPVEQYDGSLGVAAAFVAAHQAPVCQVQWNSNLGSIYSNPGNVSGVRWGTGTMVSADILVTCGHLFDQTGGDWDRPRQNGTTNIISPQEIARNMKVNFNYQVDPAGNLRLERSFAVLELLEYRLGGLDMAICRIDGNPGATFGRALISSTDAAAPEMICIIGHPAGEPKRVEAGPTTAISGNFIRYNDIDTLGGNSGSGILRASDGKLVGIHTNGGCTGASPSGSGSNFGQRIAAVIAASPTLQGLLTPKSKIADDPLKPVLDPQTVKFRDDNLKPVFDQPPVSLKFRDDGTLKFRDDGRFPGPKVPGQEVKLTGFDVPFPSDRFRQAVRPGRGEAPARRPFILATPHHSNSWEAAAGHSAAAIAEAEPALVQLEQLLLAGEAELEQLAREMMAGEAELARLDTEYRQLLAQIEAAGGRR